MRFVVFDDHQVGLLEEDGIRDLTDLLPAVPTYARPYRMNALIDGFDGFRDQIEERRGRGSAVDVASVTLRSPTPRPRNFLAAPLNYAAHGAEMKGPISSGGGTPRELGLFIKASGCIVGPSDDIQLPPIPDRRFDHEGEVGVVVGRTARSTSASEALDHVFGYTLLLDVTMRMTETQREERTMRKSYATFSPVGPCIVTTDEIPDPASLSLRLWVGDQLRQEGRLKDLIVGVPELVAMASAVFPLEPGDLIATGSPSGVGPIVAGDTVTIESPMIGTMRLDVTARAW